MPQLQFVDRDRVRRELGRYARALLVVAIAIGLRLLFEPYLGTSGFAVFLAAILVAAWVGGLGPSLIGQTLILVATSIWFPPEQNEEKSWGAALVGLAVFYGVGTFVALLSQARRRAHERELAQRNEAIEQRERLRATLECMQDGVLATDVGGRVTLMNPAAEKMTGWSADEARGLPLRSVFLVSAEDSSLPLADPIQHTIAQSSADLPQRSMLLSKPGHRLPIVYSASPIRSASGQPQGHVVVMHNESERRRMDRALSDANRRKDEFLATLAHELRNPLAPICAGLELLKLDDQEPEAIHEVLSIMDRQTRQMVRLIDDLLDVSRITRGKLELRKGPVLLADIVRNAVEANRPLVDELGHELIVEFGDQGVLVSADANRLTQVLSNLLNNAARYTHPRGRIELSAANRRSEVVITVRDNGIGIPADKLDYVFEMFAQVNGQTGCGHTGLGIGLTLVKQLVEMHGGTVEVKSDGRNQGSLFRVRLPTIAAQGTTDASSDAKLVLGKTATVRRVLIVDDNADALATLSRMVELLGHEVCTASDGLDAVGKVDSFRPEVVLMDLGMPKLNGFDAARRIRNRPGGGSILLVATTGWGQDEDRRRTASAGFDGHLVKPIDLATLQSYVEQGPSPHPRAEAASSIAAPEKFAKQR